MIPNPNSNSFLLLPWYFHLELLHDFHSEIWILNYFLVENFCLRIFIKFFWIKTCFNLDWHTFKCWSHEGLMDRILRVKSSMIRVLWHLFLRMLKFTKFQRHSSVLKIPKLKDIKPPPLHVCVTLFSSQGFVYKNLIFFPFIISIKWRDNLFHSLCFTLVLFI